MRFYTRIKKYERVLIICVVLGLLSVISIAGIISCGKLSDDTNRPTSAVGNSGGQSLPINPQSSWGTYALTLTANTNTIPADGVSSTTLHAKITDTSGRSVENFIVNFQTQSSDAIAVFMNPGTTTGSATPSTTTSGVTHAGGSVSVNVYGLQSGSAVIQASVDLDSDGADDLTATTTMVLTPSGPASSAGAYTLSLDAVPSAIPADKGTCSTITATLTDRTGGSVENIPVKLEDLTKLGSFSKLSTTAQITEYEGLTNNNGKLAICFYGYTAGTSLIKASVVIPDLSATLQKTVTVTISEVTIPSPKFEFTLGSPTVPCPFATVTTATLDSFVLVTDSAGNRIGGITLGFWFLTLPGCSGVNFADFSGTVTTDTAGRARITTVLTGTGTGTCQYRLEIAYQGKSYVSPTTGTITSCGSAAPTATPVTTTLTMTASPSSTAVGATTANISLTALLGGAIMTTPVTVSLVSSDANAKLTVDGAPAGGAGSVSVSFTGTSGAFPHIITLTYPAAAARPTTVTVFGTVTSGGSGNGSTTVTFN